jgi:hypothetical protein
MDCQGTWFEVVVDGNTGVFTRAWTTHGGYQEISRNVCVWVYFGGAIRVRQCLLNSACGKCFLTWSDDLNHSCVSQVYSQCLHRERDERVTTSCL